MSREAHVRFWEGLGVRFPRPTRYNHNWTMDVALAEDDVQPCQQSRNAIEVVAWLRVLGYNLLAAWRAKADKKDRNPMPWARCMEQLRDAFLFASRAMPHVTPS